MAYDLPTPATLRMVYPAFADTVAIPDATIQFWLDRVVGKDVDQSWPAYGADAQIAAAAHRMIRAGVTGIKGGDAAGALASGLTRWRSGSADLQFSEAAITQAVEGGWASTAPGQDYWELLQRFAAGPRLTLPGAVPCNYGYNGWAGPLPNGYGYGFG